MSNLRDHQKHHEVVPASLRVPLTLTNHSSGSSMLLSYGAAISATRSGGQSRTFDHFTWPRPGHRDVASHGLDEVILLRQGWIPGCCGKRQRQSNNFTVARSTDQGWSNCRRERHRETQSREPGNQGILFITICTIRYKIIEIVSLCMAEE